MMTIDEMRIRKRELLYTYDMIAERSGLPVSTVQKVLCGVSKNPRRETMQALETALKKPVRRYEDTIIADNAGTSSVKEEAASFEASSGTIPAGRAKRIDRWIEAEASERWPRQGEYTAEDYFALPDDIRVELIDGMMYDMASPTDIHQFLQTELTVAFYKCIEEHERNCLVLSAPFDVRLDGDDKTIVQPDVLIMCEREDDDLRNKEVPDLVAEVLSPSTRAKDCTIKLRKYMNAGVREYWIIDPKGERVIVYVFDEDLLPAQYGFDDKIPVGISGGECEIDFSRIHLKLSDARKWGILGSNMVYND